MGVLNNCLTHCIFNYDYFVWISFHIWIKIHLTYTFECLCMYSDTSHRYYCPRNKIMTVKKHRKISTFSFRILFNYGIVSNTIKFYAIYNYHKWILFQLGTVNKYLTFLPLIISVCVVRKPGVS